MSISIEVAQILLLFRVQTEHWIASLFIFGSESSDVLKLLIAMGNVFLRRALLLSFSSSVVVLLEQFTHYPLTDLNAMVFSQGNLNLFRAQVSPTHGLIHWIPSCMVAQHLQKFLIYRGPCSLTVEVELHTSIDLLGSIQKAILKSDLGLNPVNDGRVIRINIPPLTEERRQELIKVVRRRVEEGRIAIRNLRREAMDELKEFEKNKDISQDEHKRSLNQLQKLTDSFISNIEQIGRGKEVQIMEV